MNHWAIKVAKPEPPTPQPSTITNATSKTVLSTAPATAAARVMPTFWNPRYSPLAAYTNSIPGAPSTTARV